MTLLNEIVVYKNVNNIEIACNNNKKRSFPLNSYGQSWVVQCVVRWVCCQVIYGHWPYYWNVMDEIWTDKTLKSTLSMIQYRNASSNIIFTVLHMTVFDPSTPKNVAKNHQTHLIFLSPSPDDKCSEYYTEYTSYQHMKIHLRLFTFNFVIVY